MVERYKTMSQADWQHRRVRGLAGQRSWRRGDGAVAGTPAPGGHAERCCKNPTARAGLPISARSHALPNRYSLPMQVCRPAGAARPRGARAGCPGGQPGARRQGGRRRGARGRPGRRCRWRPRGGGSGGPAAHGARQGRWAGWCRGCRDLLLPTASLGSSSAACRPTRSLLPALAVPPPQRLVERTAAGGALIAAHCNLVALQSPPPRLRSAWWSARSSRRGWAASWSGCRRCASWCGPTSAARPPTGRSARCEPGGAGAGAGMRAWRGRSQG